eukprot:scaffold9276_cov146-Skeletonema_marinoi.AAC.5
MGEGTKIIDDIEFFNSCRSDHLLGGQQNPLNILTAAMMPTIYACRLKLSLASKGTEKNMRELSLFVIKHDMICRRDSTCDWIEHKRNVSWRTLQEFGRLIVATSRRIGGRQRT